MRTLFLSFIAIVGFSAISFSQISSTVAVAQSKTELASSKETGKYLFVLPSGLTSEEVAKNAKYYTLYFTVDYNQANSEAKISMITNDEKSRHVVIRFLSACGVQTIRMDGSTISTEEFFLTYMK